MNYLTGLGFIGQALLDKIDATAVPHQKILTTTYQPFEYFFYLAAYGNMYYQTESDLIMNANVIEPLFLIEQIKHMKFKSFVFMSTSSVKLQVQTMYSRSKRAMEEILLSYMERYDLPICIIRPFTVIGKGEHQEHLIPQLIQSCRTKKLLNFVPNATHDFIDVEDVVDGIINLASHGARGIFELGTGVSHSNDQVRLLVEKATKKKANINLVKSLREYDAENWVSTNFRARGWGWSPKKTISDSIKEML